MKLLRRTTLALAATALAAPLALAQSAPKLKVGLMLPYTGTYAALGTAIENGFRLYVEQQGGKLGGREIEYFKVDDESAPPKATDNVNKLIKRDHVDVLIGTVHSGVAMAMAKAAKDSGTLLIVPNGGADAITGPCAPPTSSAAPSPTRSRATPWAKSPRRRSSRPPSPSPGNTPPATSRSRASRKPSKKAAARW